MEDINVKVLDEVNKGTTMGMDAIHFVSAKVGDERFKKVFLNSPAGELELNFKNTEDLYLINIENKKFVFLKCNSDSHLYYDDLDILLKTDNIDGFNTIGNRKYLWAIVVDGTFDFDEYCENQKTD